MAEFDDMIKCDDFHFMCQRWSIWHRFGWHC